MITRPWIPALLLLTASSALAGKPPAPFPGRPAPEAVFEDMLQAPAGTPLNIALLQGRVIVLEFWATWCKPCIESIPHLNQLAEQLGDDVTFIAVTDESRETVEPLLDKLKMSSWIAFDTDRSVFNNYDVHQWPYTVVIDAEGVVAAVTAPQFLSFEELSKVVRGEETSLGGGAPDITPGVFDWETDIDPSAFRAEIHASTNNERADFQSRNGRVTGMAMSVHGYAMWAWDTGRARILIEGFDNPWEDRFDVVITAPSGTVSDAKAAMRSLLQESLGLTIGWEDREVEALALRRLDGSPPELIEEHRPIGDQTDEHTNAQHYDPAAEHNYTWIRRTVRGDRLSALCDFIEMCDWAPVIDETGLDGFYSWTLELPTTDTLDKTPNVARELGLRLAPVKRTVPMLVIKPREPD